MSNYSKFERRLAKILSGNPRIKSFIKKIYQRIVFVLNQPSEFVISKYDIKKIESESYESFFGYYDNNPECDGKVLYQVTSKDTSLKPGLYLDDPTFTLVRVTDLFSGDILFSKETKAYNWQQGSKLQWISKDSFVYNDLSEKGNAQGKLIYLSTGEEKTLPEPIYDTYKADYYLSLNYAPLTKLRPDYAYFNGVDHEYIDFDNQYIKYCTFDGNNKVLITLKKIVEDFPLSFQCGFSKQKFNHIMISPLGQKFVFLHRAYNSMGKRVDRLFLGEINFDTYDCDIRLISDSGMISHYCWVDDGSLISYMNHNDVNGYYRINLSKQITLTKINIDNLDSFGDGHPTYIGDSKFITDSYPDKSRIKQLLLVDMKIGTSTVIGSFLEPLKFHGETRCDLHPKWDAATSCVYIDSVHEGKRSLYKVGPII
ncbi:hypothetical protein BCS98_15290 [Vibrio breoganii]|uniref:hypothetical protein n=1 Tax=Vibrio breoganii TaxID=553239 RepID=UPI000C85EEEB|nr:hypothetical protein [Vibrio breoganii]PMO90156.1 hypothetical protein BCS98_15290 [Vibrio breoganii]